MRRLGIAELSYFLDTNIAIEVGNLNEPVLERFLANAQSTFLSVLCLMELERGIAIRPALAVKRRARLEVLLETVPVVTFDNAAAEAYGKIIAQTGWNRSRDFDRMIAAHAIAADCTLVTANEDDFRDIPGLKIENWTSA